MRQFKFRTTWGDEITDVIEYIKNRITSDDDIDKKYVIYIGCDSLPTANRTATYSTVICVYKVGRGAQILFSKENKVKVYGDLKKDRIKNRLWEEIYRVVDLAVFITDSDLLDLSEIIDFQIHIDINPNEEFASNAIYTEAVGYIRGLGLDVYTKPNAMAASYAGDSICRGKGSKK